MRFLRIFLTYVSEMTLTFQINSSRSYENDIRITVRYVLKILPSDRAVSKKWPQSVTLG